MKYKWSKIIHVLQHRAPNAWRRSIYLKNDPKLRRRPFNAIDMCHDCSVNYFIIWKYVDFRMSNCLRNRRILDDCGGSIEFNLFGPWNLDMSISNDTRGRATTEDANSNGDSINQGENC